MQSKLTPGQTLTSKFPTVGETEPEPRALDVSAYRLKVHGLVRRTLQFSFDDILRLPAVEKVWDTICVTGWTHLDHRWRGVMLSTLLDLAEPLPDARFVRFVAYSGRHHDTSLPMDEARSRVLLAYAVDGEPLTPGHGFPLRSVTEGKYFYKSVKWLREIELLAEDQLGFWERTSAYHNVADPKLEQRYDPKPISEEKFAQCLAARDFRGVMAIMDEKFAQLRGMDLSGARFEEAAIKSCDLSGVILRGARCHKANFTRTRFLDADLRGADCSGCDFEGADLRGADLREADLRGTFLTVTRFSRPQSPAKIAGARFLKKDIQRDGIGEREQEFLLNPQNGAMIE
jgi:hypothetical protein